MDVKNTAIQRINGARDIAIITEMVGSGGGAHSKIGLTIEEERRLFVLNADAIQPQIRVVSPRWWAHVSHL